MPNNVSQSHFLRLLAAAAALLIVLFLLTVLGELRGWVAALLWFATAISLISLYNRYTTDLENEQRRARILSTRRSWTTKQRVENTPAFLTNIVEGMGDPLILLDMKRRVVEANRAARELLGNHIVDKDIAFYLRHPLALKAIEQAIADGAPRELEISLLDPVERAFLMRVTIIDATDKDATGPEFSGNSEDSEPIQYLILSILDITKIKLAEKMRVDFVANASHELRTPLASVIGFIETLDGPAANDAVARKRFLGIMMAEASRMQRLIDDLLSLSKIEMDQHLPPEGIVDLAPLLTGLANTLELRGGDPAPLVTLHVPADLPSVRGDRDQLTQVFQNLIDNAIKYGRPEEPVEITANAIDNMPGRSGPGVGVTVFNPGDGIPAEHLPRLTERFYRVDNARSRKLGGTGLGLAIVKHIITRHRGAMNIDSLLGVGTTVTVYLPQAKASQSELNYDSPSQ
ncbi:sensor histidine kinase [Govanella unica]|uniref:histidine kinase n=1 Tax=Govanella unica TaxID=2975056 RepID=A0A9X3TXQ7_9PROT|nr:ATP-binding protein [Govania unica]MDA5193617.1 ATP-binding protein [Govania unica]